MCRSIYNDTKICENQNQKIRCVYEEIGKFFGRWNELVVAREYINEHLQNDPTLYKVLYDWFNEAFVRETNKQILQWHCDSDITLRRAISGVLSGETNRQALNYRKAVCNTKPIVFVCVIWIKHLIMM